MACLKALYRRFNFIFIFVFMFTFSFLSAQDDIAYLQIISEPDVSIFLDDVYYGITVQELDGLIIDNATPGEHKIKCVKDSYIPQESIITLQQGQVFVYRVNPLMPKLQISQSGHMGTHVIKPCTQNLHIQSLPVSIQINIPSLGLNSQKSADVWKAENVPCGEYDAEFVWHDRVVRKHIILNSTYPTHLFVDMVKGEVLVKQCYVNNDIKDPSVRLANSFIQNIDMKSMCVKFFFFALGLILFFFPSFYVHKRISLFTDIEVPYVNFLFRFKHYLHKYHFIQNRSYHKQSSLKGFISLSMICGVMMILASAWV